MSLGKTFAWSDASTKAIEIAEKLMPHCQAFPGGERPMIAVAGSIRRGVRWVSDIDIVLVPKMDAKEALFGVSEELCKTDFYRAVQQELWSITAEGTKQIRGQSYIATSSSISVDLYIASPESFATLLLIRTGSKEHNIWMCSRAFHCGGKLHADGSGLELAGQYDPLRQRTMNHRLVKPESEEEIFKLLGLPFAEPKLRECRNARPLWMESERHAPTNGGDVMDAAAGER